MSEQLYDEIVGQRYVDRLRQEDRDREIIIQKILDLDRAQKIDIMVAADVKCQCDDYRDFIECVLYRGCTGYEQMTDEQVETEWVEHLVACSGPDVAQWSYEDLISFQANYNYLL